MFRIYVVGLACLSAAIGCSSKTPQPETAKPAAPPAEKVAVGVTTKLKGEVQTAAEKNRSVSADYGQVSMQNNTDVTLDLYVDGNYGCRALKGLFCTTQVTVGTHTLEAKAGDGRSISTSVTINAGDSITWTISVGE
jgi:hypothetical protein